jgi:ABC-type nitrate/sulfonate/bicarbonate transport system substrate-binding protein
LREILRVSVAAQPHWALRGETLFSFSWGRAALAALIISGLFFLLAAAQVSFAAAAPITVRVGYPQPSGAQLPLWVMSEAKLDRKYGVDLQNIYISGGARLTQTLVAGDIGRWRGFGDQ